MLLRTYLQIQHGLSRRKVISLIDEKMIFLNASLVGDYSAQVQS